MLSSNIRREQRLHTNISDELTTAYSVIWRNHVRFRAWCKQIRSNICRNAYCVAFLRRFLLENFIHEPIWLVNIFCHDCKQMKMSLKWFTNLQVIPMSHTIWLRVAYQAVNATYWLQIKFPFSLCLLPNWICFEE